MMLALLFVRTAIGLVTGALGWALCHAVSPEVPAMIAAVLAGLLGGMACASLSPMNGQQIALICGVIMTAVAFAYPWRAAEAETIWLARYWPIWILPAYLSGAATWLVTARALQNSRGGASRD